MSCQRFGQWTSKGLYPTSPSVIKSRKRLRNGGNAADTGFTKETAGSTEFIAASTSDISVKIAVNLKIQTENTKRNPGAVSDVGGLALRIISDFRF